MLDHISNCKLESTKEEDKIAIKVGILNELTASKGYSFDSTLIRKN